MKSKLAYAFRFIRNDGVREYLHYLLTGPKYFDNFPVRELRNNYPVPFDSIKIVSDKQMSKWLNYFPLYEKYFNQFMGDNFQGPLRILEIGVARGGSLEFWETVFGKRAIVYGIDISSECQNLEFSSATVRIGSQIDPLFLDRVVSEMGGLDIVIDDGSHLNSHVIKTFEILFKKLNFGGIYFIEDVATSYWPGVFRGGFRRKLTMVEYFKNLIDIVNLPFFSEKRFKNGILEGVHSIHFHQSVIVIGKQRSDIPTIGRTSD
jgi:hypothetical protein